MNFSSFHSLPTRVVAPAVGLVIFSLLAGCTTNATKLVTVRSVVAPQYASERAQRVGQPPETFVMAKGRIVEGSGYYSTLTKTEFETIARTLAADLERAGYRPATDPRTADLVVRVNWGVTGVVERAVDLHAYDPDNLRQAQEAVETAREQAAASAGTANATNTALAVAKAEAELRAEATYTASLFGGNDLQSASNADLLGFREVLQASDDGFRPAGAAETIRDMVNEERYFVVLVAYDARAARQGQRRPVWTTRMSIGAAGQDFPTGLDRMSHTAGPSHGVPQVGILLTPSVDRPAPLDAAPVPVIAAPAALAAPATGSTTATKR